MQAKTHTPTITRARKNRFFNQDKFGSHEVSLFHVSSNPQEASSLTTSCNILVYFQIFPRSVETLPLWSIYTQQLVFMTVQTPPCEASSKSRAILFWITTFDRLDTSVCRALTASVVLFSMFSITANMFTMAFSNSLTPSHGRNYLTKL